MKRLTFDPKFQQDIKDHRKTWTSRWSDKKLSVKDRVAAVSPQKGKPGFLVPASDRFAELEITDAVTKVWFPGDPYPFPPETAVRSGFESVEAATAFYEANRPLGACYIRGYGFAVVA